MLVPTNYFWDFYGDSDREENGLNFEVKKAVEDAIEVLRGLGARITYREIPSLGDGRDLANPFERAYFLAQLEDERKQRFSSQYRYGLEWGSRITAVEYMQHIERTNDVRHVLEQVLQEFDGMVMPTVPIVAPYVDTVSQEYGVSEMNFARAIENNEPPPARTGSMSSVGRYTSPFNLSGQPALTVPCGINTEGMPIGMMITGNRFDEAAILRIGYAFQSSTKWHEQIPTLST